MPEVLFAAYGLYGLSLLLYFLGFEHVANVPIWAMLFVALIAFVASSLSPTTPT